MSGRHIRGGLIIAAMLLLTAPVYARDTVYYYYTDALHSAVVETDAQGTVLESTRTHYAPYGQVLNRAMRDGPGYTGHEEDPGTGLVYMQQRYYDPESGRFLSTDPVQAGGGGGSFNRYAYAKDNPYRYTDPFGLFKCAASASASDCKTLTSQMKSAIKLIQKAADNLSDSAKFTNRIAGGNLNKLVTFLKSDNAVVGMGNSSSSSELGSAQGEAHHPVGITTLQAQRLRSKTADTSRIAV